MRQHAHQVLPGLELDRRQLGRHALQRDQPPAHAAAAEARGRGQHAPLVRQPHDGARARRQFSQHLGRRAEHGDVLEPDAPHAAELARGAVGHERAALVTHHDQGGGHGVGQGFQLLQPALAVQALAAQPLGGVQQGAGQGGEPLGRAGRGVGRAGRQGLDEVGEQPVGGLHRPGQAGGDQRRAAQHDEAGGVQMPAEHQPQGGQDQHADQD